MTAFRMGRFILNEEPNSCFYCSLLTYFLQVKIANPVGGSKGHRQEIWQKKFVDSSVLKV